MDVSPVLTPPTASMAEPELEGLSARVKRGDKSAVPELARQFEGVLLAQMVKEMRQTLEPGTLFGNDPGDVMGGLFDMFLGKHLTRSGGIGLAKFLERYLGPDDKTHTPATSNPWLLTPPDSSPTA
jgi:flagellar protein FlgJ